MSRSKTGEEKIRREAKGTEELNAFGKGNNYDEN